MGATYRIEPATLGDAPAIAAIYAHHVVHGTASFETVPPDAGRMRSIGRKHGAWLDTLYRQRALGPDDMVPPAGGSNLPT